MFNVNKIETYPYEFKEFCEKNAKGISRAFEVSKNIHIYSCSSLFETLYEKIKDEEIELFHASRIIDEKNIKNEGILNPKYSSKISEIILSPLKDIVDENIFTEISNKFNILISNNKKYDKIWFVVGNIQDINLNNHFYMLKKYGGELLEDTFTSLKLNKLYSEKISSLGRPCVIKFKEKISELYNSNKYFVESIITHMCLICTDNKKDLKCKRLFKESYVLKDIKPEQILGIDSEQIRQVEEKEQEQEKYRIKR